MQEEKVISDASVEETTPESTEASTSGYVEGQTTASEPLPIDNARPADTRKVPVPQVVIKQRPVKVGMVIAAFILFSIATILFAFFEFFSFTMIFLPLSSNAQDFGEALGVIFTFIFGFVISLGFGAAQLIFNIPPIVLFSILVRRADTTKKRVLFIVFLVLSCLLLMLLIVTVGLFFGSTLSASNNS